MPASPRILTLDLGSQTISFAEFAAQANGGLVLHSFRQREILGESATEGSRVPQITETLREIMADLGLRDGKVNYSVGSQSVFTRFVKLPAVDEEKIERIIGFEAQQNVPFPIDEVVWDYQLVGGGAEEQIQVVLVAIKSELLEGINGAIEAAGLRTSTVDVATMAIYNAFRYNYPDLDGCSLLIDIGARTTNVLFIEPGKVFSRSIPSGGSSASAAIAKELGEPFAAAEFRKKREGFVSLGGAYAEPSDPDIARISKLVRSTMTRLHAELMRSISHYRSQQQGAAPERVFLAGGSASTPYMREFFREKLQLPVEFFNPLRNVAVADENLAAQVSHSAHHLGEVVGLALRRATTCPIELNLAPVAVVREQTFARRLPYLALAAACLILGLAGWGLYFSRAAHAGRVAAERLQEKVDEMRRVEAGLNRVKKQNAAIDSLAAPLVTAIEERDFWPLLLEDLNARLPQENIWITELAPTSDGAPVGVGGARAQAIPAAATPAPTPPPTGGPRGAVRPGATPAPKRINGLFVRGLYLDNPRQQEVVVDFFRNLVDSPHFQVDPNNQAGVLRPSTPTATEWAYPYELRLELKHPINLSAP